MQPNENTFLFDKTPAPEWEDKAAARAQLEQDVADYLARGGKITQCKPREIKLTAAQKRIAASRARGGREGGITKKEQAAIAARKRQAAKMKAEAEADIQRSIKEGPNGLKAGRPRMADLVAKHLAE